jgi:trehalose utilization protein
MTANTQVTIWNEFRHERNKEHIKAIYPQGIHHTIASGLEGGFDIRFATLDEPEHGLTEEVLEHTDVLLWWGHAAHKEVEDEIVDKVCRRVLQGMGLIVLHSGHHSKVFKKLMGTTCDLKWRSADERERLWVVAPGHPIVEGIGEYIELEKEEMYGEFFDIPEPDELVFVSWFEGGEVFRSGCCYKRGQGKIFYFRPGHEAYPSYYDKAVQRVISHSVRWAAPVARPAPSFGKVIPPLETISKKGP